jgi:superfamily II DNA/RNA helicase
MPPEITRLTQQFLNNPVRIEASRPAMTAETISQYVVRIPTTDQKAKRTALRALVGAEDVKNGIVFCNRKSEVDIVAKSLSKHGFDASPIHGDLDQQTRMRTLDAFRSGALKLLVASDVAARGLDIPAVSHVFNYDVPHHADDYVHRIGRTGRAGRLGKTYMIVTPADARNLDKILKLIGKIPEEITLDLDWANIKDEPRAARGGRERGGRERSSSSGRGGSRGERPRRPPPDHGQVASMEPLKAEPAAERAPTRASAPERVPAPERALAPERAPAPRAAPEAEAPRRERRPRPERPLPPPPVQAERQRGRDDRRGRDRDDGDGVVGFGSDVPAFLARPPGPRRSDD